MINAVKRNIPDELLVNGKEVYQGKYYMDGKYIKKDSPKSRRSVKPQETKLCASIREACEKCGAHDGMTFSFHTELRNGDYNASMVAKVLVEDLGLKDITVAATSLGSAQDVIADYIEEGKVIGVQKPDYLIWHRWNKLSLIKILVPAVVPICWQRHIFYINWNN